jgi:hypothetical protein
VGRFLAAGLAVTAVAALAVGCGGGDDDETTPEVVKYDTELTMVVDVRRLYHGPVNSEVRECEGGRRVVLFKNRPGADRKLGTARSPESGPDRGSWSLLIPGELLRGDVYAQVGRKVGDGYVCRADRSKTLTRPREID